LEGLATLGSDLRIADNAVLTNLCALYNMNFTAGRNLFIYDNPELSMDTANALETQMENNGFTGFADIHDNNGSGLVECDIDNDNVLDLTDNCPSICNSEQLDADGDGTGDTCDDTPGCGGCGEIACEVSCDIDGDGIADHMDNCPDNSNSSQWDADDDGIGDVCDDTPGCGGCGEPMCDPDDDGGGIGHG
jgi:hypothetical protein